MSIITVGNFKGKKPRISPKLLPDNSSQTCNNADLRRGKLSSIKQTDLHGEVLKTAPLNIFKCGTKWDCYDSVVNIVRGWAEDTYQRFYKTDGVKPKQTNLNIINDCLSSASSSTFYDLGITPPQTAPSLTFTYSGGTPGDEIQASIGYVFTYVTSWGEESAPSPASAVGEIYDNGYCTVSCPTPESERAASTLITKIRIYRIASGTAGAEYQYLTEVTITTTTTTYADRDGTDYAITPTADLGEAIETEGFDAPPATLEGLIAFSDGLLAGFVGRKLYLNDAQIPYAFPEDYIKEVESNIVALGFYGTALVVATETNPYISTGTYPSAIILKRLPDGQKCVSRRGLISTKYGVIFPTPDGLAAIDSTGCTIITEGIITKEQWNDLSITDILAFFYDDKYYAFFKNLSTGFIFDFRNIDDLQFIDFDINPDSSLYKYEILDGYSDPETDTLYMLVHQSTIVSDEDDNDMTDFAGTGWTESTSLLGNGRTTQGAQAVILNAGTHGTSNYARIQKDLGDCPSAFILELDLYHTLIGARDDTDCFQMTLNDGTNEVNVQFASDGLWVHNGSDYVEVGTNLVQIDARQLWRFVGTMGTTMDVYLYDYATGDWTLEGNDVDISRVDPETNGEIKLIQWGEATDNQETIVHNVRLMVDTYLVDDDMTNFAGTGWTESNAVNGDVSQEATYTKFDSNVHSGTPGAYNYACIFKDYGNCPTDFILEADLYHESIGGTNDCFRIEMSNGTYYLLIEFGTNGLYVYNGSSRLEVGTNIVQIGVLQQWRFVGRMNRTMNVYLYNSTTGDWEYQGNADISFSYSITNGKLFLSQIGYTIDDNITRVYGIRVQEQSYYYQGVDNYIANGWTAIEGNGAITQELDYTALNSNVHIMNGNVAYVYKDIGNWPENFILEIDLYHEVLGSSETAENYFYFYFENSSYRVTFAFGFSTGSLKYYTGSTFTTIGETGIVLEGTRQKWRFIGTMGATIDVYLYNSSTGAWDLIASDITINRAYAGTDGLITLSQYGESEDNLITRVYGVYLGENPANNILKFGDHATSKLTYTWKSKKFMFQRPINFSCGRISGDSGTVTFYLYAGGILKQTKTVTIDSVFRCPGGFTAYDWEFILEGTTDIDSVVLATTPDELQ